MGSQATALLLRHPGIRPFRGHGSLLSHDGVFTPLRLLNRKTTSTTTTLRWIHNSSKYFVTLDCSFEKVWLTNNNRGFIYTYIQSPSSVSGLGSGTTITLKLLYDIDTLPSTTYRSMIVHPLIISLEIGPIVPKNHQLGLLKTRERFDFTQNVKTKIIEGCRRGGTNRFCFF